MLIEDIVDTGLILSYLLKTSRERKPVSIEVCSLIDRSDLRLVNIPLNYIDFTVTNECLIGYRLDYLENYRNLPFVATMNV